MDDTEKLKMLTRSIKQAQKNASQEYKRMSFLEPVEVREYVRGRHNALVDIWNVWAQIHDL